MKIFESIWKKKPAGSLITYISLGIIAASICILLSSTILFQNLEFLAFDLLFCSRGFQKSPNLEKIVVVQVTGEDLRKIGRWPWPRRSIGEMINALKQLGASQILLDFLYSEPSTREDDDALASAIEKAGNVYLPFVHTPDDLNFSKGLFPVEKLRLYAKGTGAVDVFIDNDGKIRAIPLVYFNDTRIYKSVVLQMVEDRFAMRIKEITSTSVTLANADYQIKIPLRKNAMVLNWQGKWRETFKQYSFSDIWDGLEAIKQGAKPRVDLSRIKDSVVIVAATALGLYDTRPNALESQYPGAGIIATALVNIFDQSYLRIIPEWLSIFIIFFFAMIPPLYVFFERFSRHGLIVIFIIAAIIFMYVFFINNVVVNLTVAFIAFMASYLMVSAYYSAKIAIDRKNLMELSTIDGLTGLFNIRYFKEVLKNSCWEAQKDSNKIFYLILCDIDFFKRINDHYGHQAGDYVIESVAKTLKHLIRTGDVSARYGGDEMIILLRALSDAGAKMVAEKIRSNIENLNLTWNGQPLAVSVSLGMARFDPSVDTQATVIKKTDDALLSAKKEGKNRVVIY